MNTLRLILLIAALLFESESLPGQNSTPLKSPSPAGIDRYALKGTLVTPIEVIPAGTILIVDNKIEAIGKNIVIPAGVPSIDTNAFIYPGLIDLHDHITWNFLPRWNPGAEFNDRYEWQTLKDYADKLKNPHDNIFVPSPRPSDKEDLACDANQYGEVKAIVGGATSVVDGIGTDDCVRGLVRNLSLYSGLYGPGMAEMLRNAVFPLELPNEDVQKIIEELPDCHHAVVAHLAEGKRKEGCSEREFKMFKARGFLREGVSIIHGVSLTLDDFVEMADRRVGLIWSPRSNIALYGKDETTDVRVAKASGVKIALAPDWSPSGSDGLLEELGYAAAWNAQQQPPVFTDSELVQMVTIRPAELAKLDDKIGFLRRHHFADLLIIRSQETDAYRALLNAKPADVRLIIINGKPAYGDDDLMHSLAPNARLETISFCNTNKLLSLESEKGLQAKPPKPWKDTVVSLKNELKKWNLDLSDLAPCDVGVPAQ
ncbi:MAG TPA: amidohydrolase family protein [Candidatus Babeliales bacterium]|nr:amidohydrolase family protein [Candidatus Babeliales bacterium]